MSAPSDIRNTGPAFIRVAFRVEGEWWRAYMARIDTMEGAMELGAIRLTIAGVPAVKAAFMQLMKLAMGAAIEATGQRVESFSTHTAPEHEKAGRA